MAYTPKGIDYMRNKLASKRPGVLKRYDYYEMKNSTSDFNISTPPDLRYWNSCIGWCAKAVDSLADRLQFKEMRNDDFAMNEIFNLNNKDILTDSAFLSALISACCFVYISADEEGYPRLQVIDGANATGIIDPITYLLFEGYAVLKRDGHDTPTLEAHFLPGETWYYEKGKQPYVIKNDAPYALLVPIINRPDAKRAFGHSRISRACMSLTGSALRTIKRSEIAAEFYAFPQKYISGLSEEAEIDKWRATMSSLLAFTKDEDGDKPTVGQFQQQSMEPHLAQLRMFASLFAGETGLTLDDLGFATDNPSSADAIKAAHENLRLEASKAQRTFGTGLLNIGYLAACVRDKFAYRRENVYQTQPIWRPVFEPDASQLVGIGDAMSKLAAAYPDYFTIEKLSDLTGL